ncbi:SpoIIE family protein phosphatase [Geodermatophilus sabuli]|uniref:Serine/threonine-protein kinase RsbW n=1 Tax=Geodermatophilus sabuli TaxID=1564158 RepID=A0A285EHT3_9ACTN|nr:SpoIIE family protein phosphatase [Geodermatophilus sabuli]MBB3086604.1 serine/threonine-protein kinase RsbW [Geodermatophilus sabuli]SNX97744.1 serine/threonine-protein kinase RsbW [Geodermatophilus sabuli]
MDHRGDPPPTELSRLLDDDPAELYESAPCGYVSTLPDGRVVKVNRTFCEWTGRDAGDLFGTRFQDLLSTGGRVFYETHLAPLLRMQGAVREVALDVVRGDGSLLPCLVNAVEVRDDTGAPVLLRTTVFEATSRRRYERALLAAQRAAAESEARSRTVQQVVSELAAATSAREVAGVAVSRAREAVGASGAGLWLAAERRATTRPGPSVPPIELVASDGIPADLLEAMAAAAAGGAELVRGGGAHTVPLGAGMRAVWPELARALADAGQEALVVVAVNADSRHLGALVLLLGAVGDSELIDLTEPGHRGSLSRADTELLETVGRQAGQALERVRLYEETAQQAARSAFLLDAARLMASAVGVAETAELLAELAVPRLADLCVIDLAGEQGLTRPAARHGDPARQAVVAELQERHLPNRGTPHPSVRAMVEGRTVWVRQVTDRFLAEVTSDERHLELARSLQLASLVCVPLVAEGRPLGVLTLAADRWRRPFTAADVEVAEQLALQVSQVVDKAQRFEREEHTSHTLQRNLLPPVPPEVPGLAVAVRYVAASLGADVGGDFYDVVPLPGAQVALAVGDVVGHDITAAAVMGQLRSVYRSLLVDRPPPSAVIDRLQAGWSLLGLQRMATALFVSLDPATGQLRIASAGHLPPLLVSRGHAELLDVRPSRMLGAPPAPAPAAEWAGVLPPGATLVLYTDGLVESRDADLDVGLEALLAAAAGAGTADPDELCDRLLADLAGGVRADDVALLAITRLP